MNSGLSPLTPDERVQIWNTLRGGVFTGVSRDGPDLLLLVGIPHLRTRFEPHGVAFSILLRNLKAFYLMDREGGVISTNPMSLGHGATRILSTESEALPVAVATTTAEMVLDYEAVEVSLDTGQPVSCQQLLEAKGRNSAAFAT